MNIRRAGQLAALTLLCALAWGPVRLAAQADEDLDANRRASAIARTTNSPFCPGLTLDSCTSGYAAEWRADIQVWANQGESTDAIREKLQGRVDQLKAQGRIDPEFELSNRPLGTGPMFLGVAVLSVIALALVARRLVGGRAGEAAASKAAAPSGGAPRPATAGAPRDALDDALDEELRRLDR